MDQAIQQRKQKIPVVIISLILTVAILLGFCAASFAAGIAFCAVMYLLIDGVLIDAVFLMIIFAAIAADEVFRELKYNETWIMKHSEDEIVQRYGEFDYRSEADEYGEYYVEYRNWFRDGDDEYTYSRIYFHEDGTVKSVDP